MKDRPPGSLSKEDSPADRRGHVRLWEAACADLAMGEEKVPGFDLLGRVGEGGMAIVYLAEQIDPIRREVAVKVVKPGMDSAEVIARFNLERQSLALMDHSNIAQVHAAGVTAAGRPFFAMEFVEGPPLTQWCGEHQSPLRERLALFVQVCRAVQHAHQKGIIHRDLKPSNILVKEQNGRPVPKVIDFGVAKATQGTSRGHTAVTTPGRVVGTPLYMSPEQAAGSRDIDTRSDIYALGVILYELLSGETPFEDRRRSSTEDLLAAVREAEPEPPSRRLRRAGRSAEAAAVCGDLDIITLRALEKDREGRYASAESLAADVERFLGHEPILARPPSPAYRLRKLVRRHWLPAGAGLTVFASLVAGVVVSEGHVRIARQERDHARQARAQSDRVAAVLKDMFSASDPTRDGREVRVVEVLNRAASKAETELASEPEVLKLVRQTLAQTYYNLSDYAAAERLLRAELDGDHRPLASRTAEEASMLTDLGNVLAAVGRQQEAISLLTGAVEALRGREPEADKLKADALVSLGFVLDQLGRGHEAESLLAEGDRIARIALGPTNRLSAVALATLANVRGHAGDLAGRCQRYREAVAMLEMLPEARMDLAAACANLGATLTTLGEFAEAETILKRSLELRRAVFGPVSREVAQGVTSYADLELMRGDPVQAEQLALSALELHQRLGSSDPERIYVIRTIGRSLAKQQRAAEAEGYLRQARTLARENFSTNSNVYTESLKDLGDVLMQAERWAEAETAFLDLIQCERARPQKNLARTATAMQRLIALYRRTAQLDKLREWEAAAAQAPSEVHTPALEPVSDH